ncbi:ABC transporter substrate-binding protein [Anaerosporobacter faecicola]|uniref:ABC transporter substrate-binding protein n=1 Tax=Anaerosporobacter faecicola TaxID=2718714 RepID=UPI001439208C|nr:ABC transporter substrate-binding protein [Anaerosporobacter faecicola]
MNKYVFSKFQIVVGLLISFAVLLSGCGNRQVGYDTGIEGPGDNNELVVYTSHKEEVYEPIIKEFEERTGIWVTVIAGGTNELLEQIALEGDSPVCDIMFGGGVENLEAYKDYFLPYTCSEGKDIAKDYLSADGCWTPFSSLPIVFVYNNKLIYESAEPTGWKDLLGDRWKGKIAFADPNTSGSSYTALATLLQILNQDQEKTLRTFVDALDGNVLSGSGDVIETVVNGTRLVGITLEETAMKQIAAGADITMVYPREGTSAVPDGCAIIKNARNEDNAKQFIEFIISKDVQQYIVDKFNRRSVRGDIKDSKEPFKNLNVIDFDISKASIIQNEVLKQWSALIANR